MNVAVEDAVYEFLADVIPGIDADDPELGSLFEAELHDTIHRAITKTSGVRVGDASSSLSPSSGNTTVDEFDSDLVLVPFVEVTGPERSDRKAARAKVTAMSKAVAKLIFDDPTLGGRVNDARVNGKVQRGWDAWKTKPYAVANVPLIVNDTGQE